MRPDDSAVLDATPDATLEVIRHDLADSCDEEPGLGLEEERPDRLAADHGGAPPGRLDRKVHVRERLRLQHELVPRQDWVQDRKLRVVVLLESRDSAGKGGVIERITQRLNPRVCRVAALPARASASGRDGISSATSLICLFHRDGRAERVLTAAQRAAGES